MAQTVPARQTVQNMTEGSPVSLILRFALPIFISQVFQQLYSTADAFIVGKYLGTNAFADVSASAFYAPAVQWAVHAGVTTGTSDTTFSPNSNCLRAQIVSFLYRAAK